MDLLASVCSDPGNSSRLNSYSAASHIQSRSSSISSSYTAANYKSTGTMPQIIQNPNHVYRQPSGMSGGAAHLQSVAPPTPHAQTATSIFSVPKLGRSLSHNPDWRTELSLADRSKLREMLRDAYSGAASVEEVIDICIGLEEGFVFELASCKLDYLKSGIRHATSIKSGLASASPPTPTAVMGTGTDTGDGFGTMPRIVTVMDVDTQMMGTGADMDEAKAAVARTAAAAAGIGAGSGGGRGLKRSRRGGGGDSREEG
jgi:hypothetical protein